jgi:hypothetical protein
MFGWLVVAQFEIDAARELIAFGMQRAQGKPRSLAMEIHPHPDGSLWLKVSAPKQDVALAASRARVPNRRIPKAAPRSKSAVTGPPRQAPF